MNIVKTMVRLRKNRGRRIQSMNRIEMKGIEEEVSECKESVEKKLFDECLGIKFLQSVHLHKYRQHQILMLSESITLWARPIHHKTS